MVCRPGLAHQRLTPGNCHDLLFDDVLWVHEAQKDHYDFVLKMRERGVEVLDLHEMLAQMLAQVDRAQRHHPGQHSECQGQGCRGHDTRSRQAPCHEAWQARNRVAVLRLGLDEFSHGVDQNSNPAPHMTVFAAEAARREGRVVQVAEWLQSDGSRDQ